MSLTANIYSLGDAAITIDFGNEININLNNNAIAVQRWMQRNPFEGLLELVLAYSSVTVYYDAFIIKKKHQPAGPVCRWVEERIKEALAEAQPGRIVGRLHRIPVCYGKDFGPDLTGLSAQKEISEDDFVSMHAGKRYRVFMIGFMPGFAYLGKLDEKIAVPRKQKPVKVSAGSVAIAGQQTGIYPVDSPGGWNVIGRTPLSMFDANAEMPVWISPGDEVEFYPISEEEFSNQL